MGKWIKRLMEKMHLYTYLLSCRAFEGWFHCDAMKLE